ncbi:hypothetical protein KGM_213387 [Danaus plexippus plexippus]|uniref:Uncharacterized protein n=1 Tax=Danaus plexippus plexippus TaxID=278856 RepID=A0A212F8G3_DANPL|nr:hypothetical protein KGM_213387 [Danaus plexippus plexippus]
MREIVHLQAGQCGNQIGAKEKMHKNNAVTSVNVPRAALQPGL